MEMSRLLCLSCVADSHPGCPEGGAGEAGVWCEGACAEEKSPVEVKLGQVSF